MRPLVEPHLRNLSAYMPGKPIEETEREYGVRGIAKLASNENCLGPSPRALEAARVALQQTHLYPDAGGFFLKERLCQRHAAHGIRPEQLVLGNGTNELIQLLTRAVLGPGEALLNAWPSFVVYRLAARAAGRTELAVPLTADQSYDLDGLAAAAERAEAAGTPVKLFFLSNPNNPIGRYIGKAEFERFVARLPAHTVLALDEAYAEYVTAPDYPDGIALATRRPRTLVLRTFSKVFGLASLRIGYAVGDAELCAILNSLRDPFNTSGVAQAAALAALDDEEHVARSRAHNEQERARLGEALRELGLTVTPSVANFLLAHLPEGALPVSELNEGLLRRGVIIRPVANYDLPRSVRITVGTVAENDRLLTALGDILHRR